MPTKASARKLPPPLAKRAAALAKRKTDALRGRAEDLVALIREKRRVATMAFYEMGKALVELSSPELYRALGYRTFSVLLAERLEMRASYAEALMAAARALGEARAIELGHDKSLAVASALQLPGASFDGRTLVVGKSVVDTEHATARDIEAVVVTARQARQRHDGPVRGRTTTPDERARAVAYEKALRREGAKTATVRAVATKPGSPADFVFRLSSTAVPVLATVLRARRAGGKA